jgi:hypothetical protein
VLLGALLLVGLWLAARPTIQLSAASAALEAALAPGASPQQLAAAVVKLEQAAALNPDSPLVYRRIGQGYLALERPEEALQALEQAYRLDPASPLVQRDLALAYVAAGRSTNADPFWVSLGITPAHMLDLGDTHLAQREYATALDWYTRAAYHGFSMESDRAARMLVAAAGAGSPLPGTAQPIATELIVPLKGTTVLPGDQLRWLVTRQASYALPLSTFAGGGPGQGAFWWAAPAGVVIRADSAGDYTLTVRSRHRPNDGQMAVWLGETQIATLELDEHWRDYRLNLPLRQGLNLVELHYLEDKGDAFVASLRFEPQR